MANLPTHACVHESSLMDKKETSATIQSLPPLLSQLINSFRHQACMKLSLLLLLLNQKRSRRRGRTRRRKMCSNTSAAVKTPPCFSRYTKKKMRLEKRFWKRAQRALQLANLKLYFENRSIMEDNKRLRMKALQLRQENRTLLSNLGVTSPIIPPPTSLPF